MVFGRFTGGKSFKQSSKHVFLFLTLHKQHFTNGWSLQNNMLFVCVLQNGSFDYSVPYSNPCGVCLTLLLLLLFSKSSVAVVSVARWVVGAEPEVYQP